MATVPHPAAPRLAFRVGVTGKRPRSPEDRAQIEALRPRVKAVLELVRQHIHALADKVAAAQDSIHLYQNDDHPSLRLLSPLAEGADRIVAEEAGALDYELEAVLPLSQGDYETDFPNSVDQFRKILATAGERVLRFAYFSK